MKQTTNNKFCTNCGKEIKDEEKFCSNCGQNITSSDDEKKDAGSISITDAVRWQDSLKKDVDFSKSEDELTPEERVKKIMYFAMDETIENSVGKDVKNELDEKRAKMEALSLFQSNLNKIIELGKEIEKNFLWQFAYITNHFDQSPENSFKVVIDGMTNDIVNKKDMSNTERVEFSKKILEIINVYRGKVIKELRTKQEVISALLPAVEKAFTETDFDIYGEEVGDKETAMRMKSQFQEWIKLSKELLVYRGKAIYSVEEKLDIDEILPNHVIVNDGDVSKNLSGIEMSTKGERMVKLINEANDAEKDIGEKRSKLAEDLFGKPEEYMDFPKEEKSEQKHENAVNPLQDKAWFRLAKVAYIGTYGLALIISIAMLFEEASIGFWMIVGVVVIFWLIKMAFYYVTIGKTSWK